MSDESYIEFPCDFPIKIIGNNSDQFREEIVEVVLKHFPQTGEEKIVCRDSSQGAYLSITVTVYAIDKPGLDALYQELTSHPEIKMVL